MHCARPSMPRHMSARRTRISSRLTYPSSQYTLRLIPPACSRYLPIFDVARESVPASTQRESPSATPLRVLVVDDNPDAANMLVQLLQLAQHDVRAANDGRTALRIASEFTPQIVLLDISMPEMNGVEVAQRLRADPGTAHAFIAAVTGLASNEMDLDLSPNGFNERITKPLENDELLALLARATRTVARAKG